jgi:hypothetical protein
MGNLQFMCRPNRWSHLKNGVKTFIQRAETKKKEEEEKKFQYSNEA